MTDLGRGAEWIGAGNRVSQTLPGLTAGQACWPAKIVLWRLGALTDDERRHPAEKPTVEGVTFGRAALAGGAQGRPS